MVDAEVPTFYNNPENSDVTILHQDGSIKAHQIILKMNSSVLRKMLNAPMKEGQSGVIDFSHFTSQTIEIVIKSMYYMYDEKCKNALSLFKVITDLDQFEEIIQFADYLDYIRFGYYVIRYIQDKIKDSHNNDKIYRLIIRYELEELYYQLAQECKKNTALLDELSLSIYQELRLFFDYNQTKYDLLWCSSHNDNAHFELFLKDIDWSTLDNDILKSIADIPLLQTNPIIASLFKAVCDLRNPKTQKYY